MLIHKATMGVLLEVWTGQHRRGPNGVPEPVNRPARLADFPELDPAEWWEIPNTGPLARKIRLAYPWIEAVVGEAGELLDVRRDLPEEKAREDTKKDRAQEARRRGYQRTTNLRPLGMFQFLQRSEQT